MLPLEDIPYEEKSIQMESNIILLESFIETIALPCIQLMKTIIEDVNIINTSFDLKSLSKSSDNLKWYSYVLSCSIKSPCIEDSKILSKIDELIVAKRMAMP